MFDRAFYTNKMNNYASQVDHLVNTMKPQSEESKWYSVHKDDAPFDTQAYKNYKELVDKENEQNDPNQLTEHIYKLGFKIDTLLNKIINQLDTINEGLSEDENDKKGD